MNATRRSMNSLVRAELRFGRGWAKPIIGPAPISSACPGLKPLRAATGYKLAGDGHDTRSIQDYLGHKNIQHTVRYTEPWPSADVHWRVAHATSVINPLSNRPEFRARLTGSNCELALLCFGASECPARFSASTRSVTP